MPIVRLAHNCCIGTPHCPSRRSRRPWKTADSGHSLDADAKPDGALVGHLRLAVYHPALHLGGAVQALTLANSANKPPPLLFSDVVTLAAD